LFGATSQPSKGEFFALGGSDRFRGYSTADRQGSSVWVGSVEWRVPVVRGVTWDVLDHVIGARNVYTALFYDVGQAYASGHGVGGDVAHAVGAGVRVDIEWFSFIERSTFRFDVAKTVSDNTGMQFWVGFTHPF
jgi:hemolysin activation/secretion protein